jgi:hypothetical protein
MPPADPIARRTVLYRDTPTSLFRSLVQAALSRQGVSATELGEFYLVTLLESLLRPAEPLMTRPLGVRYLEALQSPLPVRERTLRVIGDTALALCGLFPESLERSLVGPEYYEDIGRHAYHALAALSSTPRHDRALAQVFGDLARRFPVFSAVLAEVAYDAIFPQECDVAALYRRWRYARSPARTARLIASGLVPLPPSGTRH